MGSRHPSRARRAHSSVPQRWPSDSSTTQPLSSPWRIARSISLCGCRGLLVAIGVQYRRCKDHRLFGGTTRSRPGLAVLASRRLAVRLGRGRLLRRVRTCLQREVPPRWVNSRGRGQSPKEASDMHSQPPRPTDGHPRPLTAERLRTLIVHTLTDQPEVTACRPTSTIYTDRLAVAVEDHTGQLWRVHVLTEACR